MNLSAGDWSALWLTLRLAVTTTLILLLLGTPLAWWLSQTRNRSRLVIESIVSLPLILPPTVLGYYLLVMLGPGGWIGRLMQALGGEHLAFTFTGLVIGSVLYSLPFMVQPLQDGFSTVGRRRLEVAATLGASPLDSFLHVVMPLSRHSYLTASTLTFAHTVGEFGIILMVGGNIPGKTRVLSVAIYDHAEAMDYVSAGTLSAGLLIFSFLLLLAVRIVSRRFERQGL